MLEVGSPRMTLVARVLLLALFAAAGCGPPAQECDCDYDRELEAELAQYGCPQLVEGRTGITTSTAIDTVFASSQRVTRRARTLSAKLDGELDALREDFGLTVTDVDAAGGLGPAIAGLLAATLDGPPTGVAEAVRCPLDGQRALTLSTLCQQAAGCDTPPPVSLRCEGACEDAVTFPQTLLECELSPSCNAAAEAEVKIGAVCRSPALTLTLSPHADLDADARATLDARLDALRARLPVVVAAAREAGLVIDAADGLRDATAEVGLDALEPVIEREVFSSTRFQAAMCSPEGLSAVRGVVDGAAQRLRASLGVADPVITAVGL